MPHRVRAGSPRRVVAAFLLLVLVPSVLVIVLGWRLYEQERANALQEMETRRRQAADGIVRSFAAALAASPREWLGRPGTLEEDGVVALAIEADGSIQAPTGVPFVPQPDPGAPLNHENAATGSRAAVQDLLQRSQHAGFADRVRLYSALADVEGVSIEGVPVSLFARVFRCQAMTALGRSDDARREAGATLDEMRRGRWSISRVVFEANRAELREFCGAVSSPSGDAERVADAIDQWWRSADGESASGHRLEDGTTILWTGDGARRIVLAALPRFAERQWLVPARELAQAQRMNLVWRDPSTPASADDEELRTAAETGLPWTLVVSHADAAGDLARLDGRRAIWLTGFGILVGVVIAGAYLMARSASRELAVARLQSDFVAAVSHEFRTPLTSMRQLTEILADDRITDSRRRQDYYRALARQTDRLHRLVESLLDLGRLEAGESPYRLEPLDACALVRAVVDEFEKERAGQGVEVALDINGESHEIAGDREALGNALWNLLDNAVKYSPTSRTVWLSVEREVDRLLIRVRDEGIGIPPAEQRAIFDKFVRGASARAEGFRGTGIGLSMVRHIVRAHGGDVHVLSAPGVGSTFTVALPIRDRSGHGAESAAEG